MNVQNVIAHVPPFVNLSTTIGRSIKKIIKTNEIESSDTLDKLLFTYHGIIVILTQASSVIVEEPKMGRFSELENISTS